MPLAARAQALEKVRITGVPTDDMTPVFYALKNGLYQQAGLDFDVTPTTSGAVAVEAVMSGACEIGKGSAISIFNAYLKGLPIRIIGNGPVWDVKTPYSMMIVASDSTAKGHTDLDNKILCVAALNDLNTLSMQAWIDQNGGNSKSIKWIEIPNSTAGTAVGDHRCEATMLQEPQLAGALETGKVRIYAPAYSAIADHFSTALYFVNADWGASHKPTVKKFLTATYKGATMTNGHPGDTAAMMSDVTKIPLAVYQKMARPNASTKSDPALVQPMINVAAKYGMISRGFSANDIFMLV